MAPLDAAQKTNGAAPLFPGLPLIGALPRFRKDPLALFHEARERYGDTVRFQIPGLTAVLAADPADVERVLVVRQKTFSKQTRGYAALRKMLGNGLVTSEGSFWLRQRRISQPGFHRERVAAFAEIMARCGREMVDGWTSHLDDGKPFDAAHDLMQATLRIVGETLLSTDVTKEADEVGHAVSTLLSQVRFRTTHPFTMPDFVPTKLNRAFRDGKRVLDGVVFGMIADRRKKGPPFPAADGRLDLMSMLMSAVDEETGESMNDLQLRDEVMTIFLAGHETTANTLTWTLHLLAQHEDVAARARAEVRRVLGDRAPTLADLPRMPLLQNVLKESMRLYPPVWMLARCAEEDDVIGGYAIPRGTIVFVSQWVTHRHPKHWPAPKTFDPDRFLVEDDARPKYAYFPFSGGPRKCIGDAFAQMEAPLILASILQRAKLTQAPGARIEIEPTVTLRPKHGMWLIATRA